MKIAICDDEDTFVEEIEGYIKEYSDADIYKFNTAEDVINDATKFDIAFLDIEIGNKSGFDLAEHIYSNNSECIIAFFQAILNTL